MIGVADALKGQLPLGLLCLNKGCGARAARRWWPNASRLVRDRIGPVAAFRLAVVVDRLPKTRSGKILRGTMSRIADGLEWKAPATIDDPLILDEIAASLAGVGLPRARRRLRLPRRAICRFASVCLRLFSKCDCCCSHFGK